MELVKFDPKVKFSYSRISTYSDQGFGCRFKYYLRYHLGNYASIGSIATDFGTLIHSTEEKIANLLKDDKPINYNQLRLELLPDIISLKTRYPLDWFTPDKTNRTYDDKIKEYLNEGIYRTETLLNSNPNLQVVGAEVKIDFMYNDLYRFTGSIDRLLFDKSTNTYIIQDVKTWPKIDGHDSELTTPSQLAIYSMALMKKYDITDSQIKCQYDLPLANNYYDCGSKGFIKRTKSKLDKTFEQLVSNNFKPNPTQTKCQFCEYCIKRRGGEDHLKKLCPYWEIPALADFIDISNYDEFLVKYQAKYELN